MLPLREGRIVWVVVLDRQGRNPKRRPVILLTPPDQVPEGQPLVGVAVSTKWVDPLPPECVRIPSNRQKQGSSRLPEQSAAVCDWIVQVHRENITEGDVGGMVFGSILLEIVRKVQPHLRRAKPPAEPRPRPKD